MTKIKCEKLILDLNQGSFRANTDTSQIQINIQLANTGKLLIYTYFIYNLM